MKKTLAILLALALVFSSVTVAFAEETLPADAKAITTLGMLTGAGNGVTLDYLKTAPTRIQAALMVLRLKGLDDEAMAFTGTDNFADADKQAWAKPIMAYLKAHPEVGFAGVGNNNFDPTKEIDAQSYYKVMLETLGYKANTTEVIGDFTWNGVFDFAAKNGLSKVANVLSYTVNDLATATVETLKANVKGGTKSLAYSLVEAKVLTVEKAIAAGVYVAPVVALEVESIVSLNLRQVAIAFNKAVDEDSAVLKTNYTVAGSALASGDTLKLLADGKTVVLTFAGTKAQQLSEKVKVSNVVTTDKAQTVATKEVTVTYFDGVAPTLAGTYKVMGPRDVRIYTSEFIASVDKTKLTINGGTVAVANATAGFSGNSYYVDVTTGSDLATGVLSFVFAKGFVTDLNSFVNQAETTISVTYAKVTEPVTVSVVSASQNSVKVKFSVPVDSSKINTPLFYHSYTTYTATSVVDSTGDLSGYDDTFTVSFTGYPLPSGAATLYVKKTESTGTYYVVDKYNNRLSADTVALAATVVADVTAPVVTKVEATSSTVIEITFDEAVKIVDAQTASNYVFKDNTGAVIKTAPFNSTGNPTTGPVLSADGKKVTITLASAITGGSYQVEVKNINDRALVANKLASSVHNFVLADTTAPQLSSAILYGNNKTIELRFNEAMTDEGLTTLTNYQLSINGTMKALPSGTTITVSANKKIVTIVLPATMTNLDGTSDVVYVANLKDSSGNFVNLSAANTAIVGATAPALFNIASSGTSNATLNTKTDVKVYIDMPVLSIDSSLVTVNGVVSGGATVADYTYDDGTVGSIVTVILPTTLTVTDVLPGNVVFNIGAVTATNGKSNTGALTVAVANVDDELAPEVKTVSGVNQIKALDLDGNGKVDTISIEYREGLQAASIGLTSFSVAGRTISAVKLDDNGTGTPTNVDGNKFVMISVNEPTSSFNSGSIFTVTQLAPVLDLSSNASAIFANINTVDSAAPVVLSTSTKNDADSNAKTESITLNFSETVYASTNIADYTVINTNTSAAITVTGITQLDNDTIVITLDETDTDNVFANGVTISVAANKILDGNDIAAVVTNYTR